MRLRILLAVTHLLGAGHLTRTAAIAGALARAGHGVTLVSGGRPTAIVSMAGIEVVQLPPVHTRPGDFSALLDEADRPVEPALLDTRRTMLLGVLDRTAPDVVVTELFPFGRRSLWAEFLALAEAAARRKPRPLVLCSVRDILVAPDKAEKVARAHSTLRDLFDGVLVHGDPTLLPLGASWPVDEAIARLVTYTGYVDPDPGGPPDAPVRSDGDVTVAGGSSSAALPLFRAALEAARLVPERTWRILVGRGVGAETADALRRGGPENVVVETARPDFRDLLARSSVFVGQAGYNTAVDLLRTRCRAVLVPYEEGRETEQRLRAEHLRDLGVAAVLPQAALDGTRLAEAVRSSLAGARPAGSLVDLEGASRLPGIIADLRARPR